MAAGEIKNGWQIGGLILAKNTPIIFLGIFGGRNQLKLHRFSWICCELIGARKKPDQNRGYVHFCIFGHNSRRWTPIKMGPLRIGWQIENGPDQNKEGGSRAWPRSRFHPD
jgi:hypothetical protein